MGVNYVMVASIIYCESGWNENIIGLNKRNGEVWSKDFGLFQLNDFYHKKEALNMGYDITDPEHNIIYGMYLLRTQGIQPWSNQTTLKCISRWNGQGYS